MYRLFQPLSQDTFAASDGSTVTATFSIAPDGVFAVPASEHVVTRRELDAIDGYINRRNPTRKWLKAQVLDYSVTNLERLYAEDPANVPTGR